MAVVENFWLKGQRKRLGDSVIYQAMGQTRSRVLATTVRNPRTTAQMNQRVKWANLVNLYRANQSWMKYAFERKKSTQSDYNKFMSLNVTGSNIFLTKDIAAAGGCVVQAYQITQGSLPSIESTYETSEGWWGTNIYLGNSFLFNAVTVADFARAVLDNNPAIREGDQLSFIRMTQMTNADNGAPYVIVRKYEVVLSLSNTSPVYDYLPSDYIDSSEAATNARLVVRNSGYAGGWVLILSRTSGGRTSVSSQRIVVANNTAMIEAYSSAAALAAAIASYGESEEAFLSSVTANTAQTAYVPNSIISVSIGSTRYTPGDAIIVTKSTAGRAIQITFSSNIAISVDYVRFVYRSDGVLNNFDIGEVTTSGSELNGTMPTAADLPDSGKVVSVIVTDDAGNSYVAAFQDSTVPGGGGLE